MLTILKAIGIVFIISLILGILLAIASKVFSVKEDFRVSEVRKMLPGINCGGCGYPGCLEMADSIVNHGNKKISACRPSNPEAREKIKEYLANTPGPDGNTITGLH